MDKVELGSKTAKGGFLNEIEIVEKFNNWQVDKIARNWLEIMGYKCDTINNVEAIVIPTKIKKSDLKKYGLDSTEDYNILTKFKKADAQIKLTIIIGDIIKIENISIKKANSNANYNQVDKRPVSVYKEMWGFDDEIEKWLKLFTGKIIPIAEFSKDFCKSLKSPDKRMYINEMPEEVVKKIVNFFEDNKILVISDILKGKGGLSADWLLVTKKSNEDETEWILEDINKAMNFYGKGKVCVSPRGSLHIGKITMQRKGGTPDPESLQFKFHPCDLFQIKQSQ